MDHGTARLTEDLKAIADTRHAIADKLGLIERRITYSVEDAKMKAQEFVERTQQSMAHAVESVKTFSPATDVADRHPWILVGGSLLLGYAIGLAFRPSPPARFAPGRAKERVGVMGVVNEAIRTTAQAARKPIVTGRSAATSPPAANIRRERALDADGFFGAIRAAASQELHGLRADLMDAAKALAMEWVKQGVRSAATTLAAAASEARTPRETGSAASRSHRAADPRSRHEWADRA